MTTATNIGVRAALRFRDVGGVVVDAAGWLGYLNATYNDINTKTPLWPWLESSEQTVTVLANTRAIALPTDIWTLNWAYDLTDDYRLIPQEGRGDQWHQDHLRSETGQPVTYRVRSNTIEVFPQPTTDTVLKLEGVFAPAALTGGQSPIFGQQWDEVLIEGMLAKAYHDDGNAQWAASHQAIFDRKLADMVNWYLLARMETNAPIRDTFWS